MRSFWSGKTASNVHPKQHQGEWLLAAAKSGERVAVLDSSGRLVNVGHIAGSNDDRRVYFVTPCGDVVADVWLESTYEPSEFGHRIVRMTVERWKRWEAIQSCRTIDWAGLSDETLSQVMAIAGTAHR